VRDEATETPTPPPPRIPQVLARATFSPRRAYIITGGLGGFGLEVARWLVEERGVRRLVLTSRAGRARDGFQARRLRGLRAAGANVLVSRRDVGASQEEASALMEETQRTLGPIGGVFHLAMVMLLFISFSSDNTLNDEILILD
jgi:fatty acid synthase